MGVTKQQLLNTVRQLKEYIDYTSGTGNLSKYLAKDNTTEYTPTENFHPATKKYVDETAENVKPKISSEENNAIEQKEDGLFVSMPDKSYGKSAYDLAIDNGFEGTETEWLASLKGSDGKDGQNGKDGADGAPGKNGADGADGKNGQDGANGITPHIGENGNWFIENTDTGVKAEGGTGSVDISTKEGNAISKEIDGLYVPSVSEVQINPADNNAIQQTENGIFVEDKTKAIDLIKNKVNNINLHQKYVNTELEYISLKMSEAQLAVTNEYVRFNTVASKSSNIGYDLSNYSVKLKAGRSYQINAALSVYRDGGGGYIYCTLQDITNDINLCDNIWLCPFTNGFNTDATGMTSSSLILTPVQDIYVAIKILYIRYNTMYINPIDSNIGTMIDCYFNVQEIGRQVNIDPVEYVNTTQGIEDTPVGHILAHMSNNAPKHYLICDGTEYNIADYPYLAQHMIDEFGSVNYFGGDGVTTFAVPDLRGEFLRGTGTALRNSGSGSEVGNHQDGTQIPFLKRRLGKNSSNNLIYYEDIRNTEENIDVRADAMDTVQNKIATSGDLLIQAIYKAASETNAVESYGMISAIQSYTSRPTNTAVLYCIKYEPTYFFMNIPTEQINEEVALLKQQNELLTAQNTLMQQQIDQLSEIIASINREG